MLMPVTTMCPSGGRSSSALKVRIPCAHATHTHPVSVSDASIHASMRARGMGTIRGAHESEDVRQSVKLYMSGLASKIDCLFVVGWGVVYVDVMQ